MTASWGDADEWSRKYREADDVPDSTADPRVADKLRALPGLLEQLAAVEAERDRWRYKAAETDLLYAGMRRERDELAAAADDDTRSRLGAFLGGAGAALFSLAVWGGVWHVVAAGWRLLHGGL